MGRKIVALMIEDEAASAETVIKTIQEHVPELRVELETDFSKAEARIKELLPDVVILDLYQEDATQEGAAAGAPVWTHIWQDRFCPLVFHTARELPEEPRPPDDHPFVKVVRKKSKSDIQVAQHLKELIPHIAAIRAVEQEVFGVLQGVLREIADIVWKVTNDNASRDRMLMRAARRRAAAMMDEATLLDKKPMTSWEQWLIPPLGNDVLMGDLVRVSEAAPGDPTGYRLILTPSCDMVRGRARCATQVLAAKCGPITKYITAATLAGAAERKLRERLLILLTQEECGGYVALPPLPGVFPVMAAGMRDLEFLPMTEIANKNSNDARYVRVASTDSPFREKLAWTYMQIAARPGMPECDAQEFIDSIVKTVAPTDAKKV